MSKLKESKIQNVETEKDAEDHEGDTEQIFSQLRQNWQKAPEPRAAPDTKHA